MDRTVARQASLSLSISQSLLTLMSIDLMMPSDHLIPCRPLLLLPSTFPSIRAFSDEPAVHIRWPKYWSFSICPSSEYSRLISFRVDWFDLFAVQGTQESSQAPQFESIVFLFFFFWCSAFFMVQLSYLYMTTGDTIALTIQTFVGKVMSLLLICC